MGCVGQVSLASCTPCSAEAAALQATQLGLASFDAASFVLVGS